MNGHAYGYNEYMNIFIFRDIYTKNESVIKFIPVSRETLAPERPRAARAGPRAKM